MVDCACVGLYISNLVLAFLTKIRLNMIESNPFGQSRSPRTNLVHSQIQEVGWSARSLKGDGHIPSEIRAGRVGEAVSARGDGGAGGAAGVHSVPGPSGGLSLRLGSSGPSL